MGGGGADLLGRLHVGICRSGGWAKGKGNKQQAQQQEAIHETTLSEEYEKIGKMTENAVYQIKPTLGTERKGRAAWHWGAGLLLKRIAAAKVEEDRQFGECLP